MTGVKLKKVQKSKYQAYVLTDDTEIRSYMTITKEAFRKRSKEIRNKKFLLENYKFR